MPSSTAVDSAARGVAAWAASGAPRVLGFPLLRRPRARFAHTVSGVLLVLERLGRNMIQVTGESQTRPQRRSGELDA